MVIRMNRLLAAHLSAQKLNCSVGDDLVGVHVGLSARAGLPDDEGEVAKELPGDDFIGSLLNGFTELGIEGSELGIDGCSGSLEDTEGADDWRWEAIERLIDVEVLERSGRARQLVGVGKL